MPIKTLLGLALGNLIWSAHPVMGKFLLRDFSYAEAAWLRYASALVAFLAGVFVIRVVKKDDPRFKYFFLPRMRSDWALGLGIGFMAFCLSPLLQMGGLAVAPATDNALIIAMEPLITVVLAWIFLGEALSALMYLTFAAAITGFALLADLTPAKISHGWDPHMWGNLLMLLALVGEAAYSVMGRTLIKRHTPVSVFGVAILSGVSFLTVATYLIHGSLPLNFAAHIDKKALLALLWLGPFGTTASYIFWMFALRQAPVASIALTLFIQPVFGAVWGYFILNERLSATQFAGGAMILLAVFAQTLVELFSGRGRKKPVA